MTKQPEAYDVIIIGSGIVGSCIARELSRYSLRIAVLDKASDLPSGASKANSSMIHGGFDDKPGTVKASLVARGNSLYHNLYKQLDFHLEECGSYVCAFCDNDMKRLEMLREQGKKNGVPGLEIITGDALREKEPNISKDIIAALWSPTAAIVNNFEAVIALIENAMDNGAHLYLETEATQILFDDTKGVYGVESTQGTFNAPLVINAAGVHSDAIARMVGDASFTIHPTRGEYFITDRQYGTLINSFFFACPSDKGKGITVARTAEGNLLFGPNSVRQDDGEWTGTTVAGLQEVIDGAAKLLPSVGKHMSITTFSGIRANSDADDFYIAALDKPRGFINVAGIKSPGFTCAPAIAERVVEIISEELSDRVALHPSATFIPTRRHVPRFLWMSIEERQQLIAENPQYAQIVCRCETVTEGQVVEAVRRGARTVSAVKMWTRAGTGRCQAGFCTSRIVEIMARELGVCPESITRHGGESFLLKGKNKQRFAGGDHSE